jgi:hypothetical protein
MGNLQARYDADPEKFRRESAALSTEEEIRPGVVISTSVATGHKCVLINMPPKGEPLPPLPPRDPDFDKYVAKFEEAAAKAKPAKEGDDSDSDSDDSEC